MSPLLRYTLVASALLHAVILSIHFELPERIVRSGTTPPLEVSLVNARTPSKPNQPDLLAQVNLDGGGQTEQQRRLSSPLPRAPIDAKQTQLALAREKVEALERETRLLLEQLKSARQQPLDRERREQPPVPTTAVVQQLSEAALELQRLEAQIAREFENYQQRPRKRHIGARAAEYRFARYIEDWRQRVERIGNANYPEAARRERIYGSLIVTVGIRADGSVESVEIDRSSGSRILDNAARRILDLAAPFAPFPPDIRRDTDILYITRTWSFTREGGLESSAAVALPVTSEATAAGRR
ncbi:MAG: energy transducer TonB [Casimicrobiaceae bacterium]|nr:energy transducer TonB [Casimicrobiaceae bacterium]MCX8097413.1 energy transducer TonB [Casimicrobiaceae bacterium]MDW8312047.1 energy transducer TonB [Burkholderiales bacterium]